MIICNEEFKLTQEMVDDVVEESQDLWDKLLKESGLSQSQFIAKGGKSTELLFHFKDLQDEAQAVGLDCPDLVEGITLTWYQDELCVSM